MNDFTKKKLLIIGPVPPPFAGPEIGTQTLLQSQVLNAHFTVSHLNTTVRKSNRDKGRVDARIVVAYIRYCAALTWHLVVGRPDYILYCPTSATLQGWVRDGTTLLLCRFHPSRLYMQFRGGHFRLFYFAQHHAIQMLLKWLLNLATGVMPQSRCLAGQFEGIVDSSKIICFPNSIASNFFDFFEEVERAVRPFEVVILYVGHLSHAKGYCDLLEVLPRLCRVARVRFRIIGTIKRDELNILFNQATGERLKPRDLDDCYREYVANTGLADRLDYLGDGVTGEAKLSVFRDADIFVLPSYSEGFSMAILEAMAAGLPVVTTHVGAAPDIIQDEVNGFLVRPGDTAGLGNRLETLIIDGDRRVTMGKAARSYCNENFHVAAISRNLVKILTGCNSS